MATYYAPCEYDNCPTALQGHCRLAYCRCYTTASSPLDKLFRVSISFFGNSIPCQIEYRAVASPDEQSAIEQTLALIFPSHPGFSWEVYGGLGKKWFLATNLLGKSPHYLMRADSKRQVEYYAGLLGIKPVICWQIKITPEA